MLKYPVRFGGGRRRRGRKATAPTVHPTQQGPKIKARVLGLSLSPGRSGWSPTQTPHRSVLAQLTHTAPHLMLSLPWRSVVVSLTRWSVSMDRPCCPPTVHETLSPSLPRVPRVGSPGSRVLWDAPTPCRPSRRASLPSLGDTTLASDLLPPAGTRGRGHGELVFRFPSRKCRWKRQGLSGSRTTLVSLRPALRPR
jgi:hypothetical protein